MAPFTTHSNRSSRSIHEWMSSSVLSSLHCRVFSTVAYVRTRLKAAPIRGYFAAGACQCSQIVESANNCSTTQECRVEATLQSRWNWMIILCFTLFPLLVFVRNREQNFDGLYWKAGLFPCKSISISPKINSTTQSIVKPSFEYFWDSIRILYHMLGIALSIVRYEFNWMGKQITCFVEVPACLPTAICFCRASTQFCNNRLTKCKVKVGNINPSRRRGHVNFSSKQNVRYEPFIGGESSDVKYRSGSHFGYKYLWSDNAYVGFINGTRESICCTLI